MVEENHVVAPDAITPHPRNQHKTPEGEVSEERTEKIKKEAKLNTVLNTVDTIAENKDTTDERLLTEFGKRMSSLIYHGGMTPSAAKAQAANEVFNGSTKDLAELLGMTRGGFGKLTRNAATDVGRADSLHYMTFNTPMNIVIDETLAAEPPADYDTHYMVMEVVNPRLEHEEVMDYDRHGPNPKLAPKEPRYCVIEETYTRGGNWSSDDPENRVFGAFNDMSVKWFMDGEELVSYLYEDEYFESEERAELWKNHLETVGFSVESEPIERVNPDAISDH